MGVDKPAPGEELNTGAVTTPREAATVIVLRGAGTPWRCCSSSATRRSGSWAARGCSRAARSTRTRTAALAGVREVLEEAAVSLPDAEALIEFSRWITPAQVKIRFDTRFYLVAAPDDAVPEVDGEECVDIGWFSPQGALEAYEREEILLVFPTIKTLEQLMPFGSADELLGWATGREVVPIEPRVVMEGEVARVVLPGEPGYEA